MAEYEQSIRALADFEHQETSCQIVQLAECRGVTDALSSPFLIEARIDGHTLTASAGTAKEAFAKAIEWRVVGQLSDVSISDGAKEYSIMEFSAVMALAEIANTVKKDSYAVEAMPEN